MRKKRIRIEESDATGYNKTLITNKAYVVVCDKNYFSLDERTFRTFDDAFFLYEKFAKEENPRIEEVIYITQIKTVFPESGPL